MTIFKDELLVPGMYRIVDPWDNAMYLIEGTKASFLLDTGYGPVGLKEHIEDLTELPITVLLTHGHVDHCMGAREFEDVRMSKRDLASFNEHSQEGYRERLLNEYYPHIEIPPLQDAIDSEQVKNIEDGEVFDLGGGVSIEAIPVPGHTVGSMMFLIHGKNAILFGDACEPAIPIMEDAAAPISEYIKALENINARSSEFDLILGSHPPYRFEQSLVNQIIDLSQAVLNDDPRKKPYEGPLSQFPKEYDQNFWCIEDTDAGVSVSYREDKAC